MSNEYIILLVLLALSYIGHNMSVFYAVGVILILKVFQLDALMQFVETNGLNYGIILLTIAILIPLATGKITVQMMIHSFTSPVGILALLAGVFAAVAGGSGVSLLKDSPDIVSSLIIGTMIGVFFFKGVAVGPLIAAGMTYMVFKFIKSFFINIAIYKDKGDTNKCIAFIIIKKPYRLIFYLSKLLKAHQMYLSLHLIIQK